MKKLTLLDIMSSHAYPDITIYKEVHGQLGMLEALTDYVYSPACDMVNLIRALGVPVELDTRNFTAIQMVNNYRKIRAIIDPHNQMDDSCSIILIFHHIITNPKLHVHGSMMLSLIDGELYTNSSNRACMLLAYVVMKCYQRLSHGSDNFFLHDDGFLLFGKKYNFRGDRLYWDK